MTFRSQNRFEVNITELPDEIDISTYTEGDEERRSATPDSFLGIMIERFYDPY